jgi:hypothetical protein
LPRWRVWNEDGLFIYAQSRMVLPRGILASKANSLLPSSTETTAGALEPLAFSSEGVKFDAKRVVVGELFGEIACITPEGEVVRL